MFLILIVFIMIIVNTVILLDPNLSKSIDSLIYINILVIITSIVFLIISYSTYRKKENKFINFINDPSQDDNYIKDNYFYMKVMEKIEESQKEVDNLRDELEEINDYMTNWIHEVKIPISVLQIISKRINEIDESRELSK